MRENDRKMFSGVRLFRRRVLKRPILSIARLGLMLPLLVLPGTAEASGFFRFQHGGRALGQAGAFTARSDDASVVTYNPAASARLEGVHILAGLDFNAATDDYTSSEGEFGAKHFIQFPPVLYATWSPDDLPLVVGLGVDAPCWYIQDWSPALFPGRFVAQKTELTLLEAHPTLAWPVTDRLSLGAGVRYVRGTYGFGDNGFVTAKSSAGDLDVEVRRLAEADIDGWGADLGVHYDGGALAAGLVLRSRVELDGDGNLTYRSFHEPGDPVLDNSLAQLLSEGRSLIEVRLPAEARAGVAWRPRETSLTLELDVAYQLWSSFGDSVERAPDLLEHPRRDRGWDDTLSFRVGIEAGLGQSWLISGGLAREPSPVPAAQVDPGFPRGDATVVAAGFGWSHEYLSFDAGYSLHLYDDRRVIGQDVAEPQSRGRYESVDQVFAIGVRWRL